MVLTTTKEKKFDCTSVCCCEEVIAFLSRNHLQLTFDGQKIQ